MTPEDRNKATDFALELHRRLVEAHKRAEEQARDSRHLPAELDPADGA